MLMKKVTVKTVDGQVHRYSKVSLFVDGENLVIGFTDKDTIVFSLGNVIFYSYKS